MSGEETVEEVERQTLIISFREEVIDFGIAGVDENPKTLAIPAGVGVESFSRYMSKIMLEELKLPSDDGAGFNVLLIGPIQIDRDRYELLLSLRSLLRKGRFYIAAPESMIAIAHGRTDAMLFVAGPTECKATPCTKTRTHRDCISVMYSPFTSTDDGIREAALAIYEAFRRCPDDTRSSTMTGGGILLIGEGFEAPDVESRLVTALKEFLPAAVTPKVSKVTEKSNSVWIGASLVAASSFNIWYSEDIYTKMLDEKARELGYDMPYVQEKFPIFVPSDYADTFTKPLLLRDDL